MVTSAEPKAGRKFLRAFRCLRQWGTGGQSGTLHAVTLPLVGGPALLLLAANVPALRPVAALLLLVGWVLLRARRSSAAISWAAVLPVAVGLTWPWVLGADVPIGEAACQDPLSAIVVRRVLAAAAVVGLVAVLARLHHSPAIELGLRGPSRAETGVALAGTVVLVTGGLLIGPVIAEPFFGRLSFPVPLAALVPAVLFGTANGVLEEVAYRGAMQAWLARVTPLGAAIAFQGLVFGIVHAGPEVVALLPVHVALLTAVGVAAGVVRARSGSLAIPIGIHVGADIALYVGLACRAAS